MVVMNATIELAARGIDVLDLDPTDDEAGAVLEVLAEVDAEQTAASLAGRLRAEGAIA